MKVVYTKTELRKEIKEKKKLNKIIGFVPTMGYLHEGHLSLIEIAKKECSFLVVSIFVNPIQFNSKEDLEKYPKDLERDLKLLKESHVDLVFIPDNSEMYPEEPKIFIDIPSLTNKLCGIYRPGHFQGVLLVVLKLFHLVEPDKAYFGEKDYQQYKIIKQMVKELDMQISIVGCPLVREESGLAMSSRNARLSKEGREDALLIYRSLQIAKQEFLKGETNCEVLKEIIKDIIETGKLNKVEYIEIIDSETLESQTVAKSENLIAVSVYTENVRLIDNIKL
ncbi:MAG: pantoate--beta-alanine ligase [Leptonema sp. (in: bacteria)]